jgi:hypothetical protein
LRPSAKAEKADVIRKPRSQTSIVHPVSVLVALSLPALMARKTVDLLMPHAIAAVARL